MSTDECVKRLSQIQDRFLHDSVKLNHTLERIESALNELLALAKHEDQEIEMLEERLDK